MQPHNSRQAGGRMWGMLSRSKIIIWSKMEEVRPAASVKRAAAMWGRWTPWSVRPRCQTADRPAAKRRQERLPVSGCRRWRQGRKVRTGLLGPLTLSKQTLNTREVQRQCFLVVFWPFHGQKVFFNVSMKERDIQRKAGFLVGSWKHTQWWESSTSGWDRFVQLQCLIFIPVSHCLLLVYISPHLFHICSSYLICPI